jgi:hypothetical protein
VESLDPLKTKYFESLFFNKMARGTAAKSASGASMSKYDVEVEARLNLIEARLAEMEVKLYQDPGLTAKVNTLVSTLNTVPAVTNHLPKDENGERKISL